MGRFNNGSDLGSGLGLNSVSKVSKSVLDNAEFDVWLENPSSVQERRSKFYDWLGMDMNVNKILGDGLNDSFDFEGEVDRITKSERKPSLVSEFSSSRSSLSCWSEDDDGGFFVSSSPKENSFCRIGADSGDLEDNVDCKFRESGSDRSVTVEERECTSGSSSSRGRLSPVRHRDADVAPRRPMSLKKWWVNRLRRITCVMETHDESCDCLVRVGGTQRVKVHQSKKRSKELSGLYIGQDIRAHKGLILTMRFSPDGKYLASAGEDRIIRVWQVVEDERSNERDIPIMDPSCVFFTMNHLSELKPLCTEKQELGKLRSLKKTSDSACVIFPPKVFRILEKPLHEFRGHSGEVLDLSWSKNNYLLSSSVDKTVRLWKVGCNRCLKVFLHSNYVTSVQFNPIDDNYFISGSIDGKVRIWEISGWQVANWTEIKDIVTAVCYHPSGQVAIVGSMMGDCRIYSISDNNFQLDAHICLRSKKKSSSKRVTGFQFVPGDPSKVMVTCADSQVRILQGTDVIGKYKGLRGSGNYFSASFTSDGKHIVSTCEDSNIYVWNSIDHDNNAISRPRKVASFERFLSNALVAVPWHGLQNEKTGKKWPFGSEVLSSESYHAKGSATWPEEKLPNSSHAGLTGSVHRSEYRFLRTCQSASGTHSWGLVIVTAGYDGRIRSFINYGLPVPV